MFCPSAGVTVVNVVGDSFAQAWPSEVSSNEFYCFVDTLMSCHFMVMSVPYHVGLLLIRKLYFDVSQYFVGWFLVDQGVSFPLEEGNGSWF